MSRTVRLESVGTRVVTEVLLDDTSLGATYALKRAKIGLALSYKAGADEGTVVLAANNVKVAGRLENVQPKGDLGGMLKSGYARLPFVGNGAARFAKAAWVADTVAAVNDIVNPTTPNGYSYRCTARTGDFKTHATTEPTWPTTLGATVVDDAVTWTCVQATPVSAAWQADTVTAVGTVVTPTTPNGRAYQCTARSGDFKTHATTEPTWPTAYGATVVDDAVTWTCIGESDQIPQVDNGPAGYVIGAGSGYVKCLTMAAPTVSELLQQPLRVVAVDQAAEQCVVEFSADVL